MSGDDVARLLRAHQLRVTPQRRAILQAFRGASDEHLSADEVLSRASAVVPEIGRGTVYAALAELTELGLLAAVGSPEPVRYEINLSAHDHFRCRLCLRLFDVDFGGSTLAKRRLEGYAVESVIVRVEGVCADCGEFQRGITEGAAEIKDRPTVASDALSELSCIRVESPIGDLALAASSTGVTRIAFDDHADFEALIRRANSRRGPKATRRHLTGLRTMLGMYFAGDRSARSEAVDWRFASPPRAQALQSVRKIPYDDVTSYDRLMVDIAAYDCGHAMGSNPVPLLVPCHRVSRGSERPTPYVGGPDRRRFLGLLEAS